MLSSNTRVSSTQSLERDGWVVWLAVLTRNLALGGSAREAVPVCGNHAVAKVSQHRERPGIQQVAKKSPAKTRLALEEAGKSGRSRAVFCRGDEPDIVADIVCGQTERVEVSSLRGDHLRKAGKPTLKPADPESAKRTISVVDQKPL